MLFAILHDIVDLLIQVVVSVVIVQFVLGLLISFNVVNMHNNLVAALWQAVNAILEPVLRPIRRRMPDTGALDLSPMVLIIGLSIIQIILNRVSNGVSV